MYCLKNYATFYVVYSAPPATIIRRSLQNTGKPCHSLARASAKSSLPNSNTLSAASLAVFPPAETSSKPSPAESPEEGTNLGQTPRRTVSLVPTVESFGFGWIFLPLGDSLGGAFVWPLGWTAVEAGGLRLWVCECCGVGVFGRLVVQSHPLFKYLVKRKKRKRKGREKVCSQLINVH